MSLLQLLVGVVALSGASASMRFIQRPLQTGDARYDVVSASRVFLNGQELSTGYQTVQRSGDERGAVFGAHVDAAGNVITSPQSGKTVSDNADFTSLLDLGVTSPEGNIIYSITQFESPAPATAYLSKLIQDPVSGLLTANSTMPIDFSGVGGLLDPCAGSVTPWISHLGSEETDPNARKFADATVEALRQDTDVLSYLVYNGVNISNPSTLSMKTIKKNFRPYNYGWMWEATVDPELGTASVVKHYAMGRSAWEQTLVMPDYTTTYLTADGGSNHGMYKFVAQPGDLSYGCLYYQKLTQVGASFNITWFPISSDPSIACTTDDSIKPFLRLSFYDIFDARPVLRRGTCPAGFTIVNVGTLECLKVKKGMDLAASRLETPRYAAMQGATIEFNKLEGITFDLMRLQIYVSITSIASSMEDNASAGVPTTKYDIGTPNDIRLPYNPCGAVYAIMVTKDFYDAYFMYPFIYGQPNVRYTGPIPAVNQTVANNNSAQDLDLNANNMCQVNGIANPDNIAYVPDHDVLLIGEDTTTGHQNDLLWAFYFRDSTLTRVLGTPFGSEVTSTYWYSSINNFAYMVAVIQHPYGESDQYRVNDPQAVANGGAACYVGYVGLTKGQIGSQFVVPFPRYNTICPSFSPRYRACNDFDPCTDDTCDFGTCVSTLVEPCFQCTSAADCKDGNTCTEKSCKFGLCRFAPQVGKVCGEGKKCTRDGLCRIRA